MRLPLFLLACATSATLSGNLSAQQFARTGYEHFPVSLQNTWAVAAGDLNGDGLADIVLGRFRLPDRLMLNSPGGRFTEVASAIEARSDDTHATVLGDVDGDGDLDLFVGTGSFDSGTGQQDRLYRNSGNGVLVDVTATALPVDAVVTSSAVFVDVDGDGDLDLFVGHYLGYPSPGSQNSVYINDGNGVFADETSSRAPVLLGRTRDVVALDADNDGDMDLFAADYGARNQLWVNDGSGHFTDGAAALPVATWRSSGVAAADVNGDGRTDLFVANFADQDRLLISGVGLSFVDESASRLPTESYRSVDVAIADFDADGHVDILPVYDSPPPPHDGWLVNDGSGVFQRGSAALLDESGPAHQVVTADLDGDLLPDVIVGSPFVRDQVLRNGGGSLREWNDRDLPSGVDFSALSVGDVDLDGWPDLLLGRTIWTNDGTGGFSRGQDLGHYGRKIFVDVDGDADLDIFVAFGGVALLRNDAGIYVDVTATYLPPPIAGTDAAVSLTAADYDGDGHQDMFVARIRTGAPYTGVTSHLLYMNTGSGAYIDASNQLPANPQRGVFVAVDVDSDGDIDLVSAPIESGQFELWRNDGLANFSLDQVALSASGQNAYALVALDVDGDADLDLIASSGVAPSLRMFRNDGSGTFAEDLSSALPVPAEGVSGVTVTDLDQDGDSDLLLATGSYTTPPRAYDNDGSGTFSDISPAVFSSEALSAGIFAVADVDRDGDEDIVFVTYGASLLRNRIRELETPFAPRPGTNYIVRLVGHPVTGSTPQFGAIGIAFTRLATPQVLPGFGLLFLDAAAPVLSVAFSMAAPPHTATLTLPIVNAPGLIGLPLFVQGVVGDGVDLRLTRLVSDVVR